MIRYDALSFKCYKLHLVVCAKDCSDGPTTGVKIRQRGTGTSSSALEIAVRMSEQYHVKLLTRCGIVPDTSWAELHLLAHARELQ